MALGLVQLGGELGGLLQHQAHQVVEAVGLVNIIHKHKVSQELKNSGVALELLALEQGNGVLEVVGLANKLNENFISIWYKQIGEDGGYQHLHFGVFESLVYPEEGVEGEGVAQVIELGLQSEA